MRRARWYRGAAGDEAATAALPALLARHDEEEPSRAELGVGVADADRLVAVDAAESAEDDVELLLLLRLVLPALLLLLLLGGAKWLKPFGTAE